MALLAIQSRGGQHVRSEFVVMGLLAVITLGFGAGLVVNHVDWCRRGRHRAALPGRPDRAGVACWAPP